MREGQETARRRLKILQLLPQRPGRISTRQILSELKNTTLEYKVNIRTIQRDLNELSRDYGIICDEEGRTHYWYWSGKSPLIEIPAMSGASALALRLAEEYLCTIMPPATLKALNPYFNRAKEVLQDSKLDLWTKKVKIIRRGPELIPPKINQEVHDAVYQALLEGKMVKAIYQARGKDKPVEYILNPQGLVMREGVIYLIASLGKYENVLQLPLQRMKKAELLNESAQQLEGFNLEKYIKEDKEFSYPVSDKKIKLKLLLNSHVATHLSECKLSEAQTLTLRKNGRTLLEATVADTDDLRWWLLGFGEGVEVLSPKSLRMEFREIVHNLSRRYT